MNQTTGINKEMNAFSDDRHSNFRETTIQCSRERKNQEINEFANGISGIFKTLFCLTSPFTCCGETQVRPSTDVIVSNCGIPMSILREPGVYFLNPLGLETTAVNMRVNYSVLPLMQVNDKHGMPLIITAQYGYQVRDSFSATYQVNNYIKFIHKQAESALRMIVSQYPYTGQRNEICLQRQSRIIDLQLKKALKTLVAPTGIQINYFRFVRVSYEQEMEKLLLAKQEAEAYIRGREAVAKSSMDIVEETLKSLQEKGIELNDEDKNSLVMHLIFMMCNEKELLLNITQMEQITSPLVMERK